MACQRSRSFTKLNQQVRKGLQLTRFRPLPEEPAPKGASFTTQAPIVNAQGQVTGSATFSASAPRGKPGKPPPAPPIPELPQVLRIALYSSNRERCGIATYASQLAKAFALLGHEIGHWGSEFPYFKNLNQIRAWVPNVFHVQYEASIMPPPETLIRIGSFLRKRGTVNAVTLHGESPQAVSMAQKIGQVIVHRRSAFAQGAAVIPMPCTIAPSPPDRKGLRAKFGIPEGAFVLSTIGFLIPWKEHSRILEALLPWLRSRPDVHVQVIASDHFSSTMKPYARTCKAEIAALSEHVPGRIHAVHNYPSDEEIIERLGASDLGYTWCPFDTGSNSAAAAQFTSARCPLVASDSTHYDGLGTGMVRGPKTDLNGFVRLIQDTAGNPSLLKTLRKNQWATYQERNYLEIARRHILLYRQVADAGRR